MISENALRHRARRLGLLVRKSRARQLGPNNRGGYRLVDPWQNAIVAGEHFDLCLAEIAEVLILHDGAIFCCHFGVVGAGTGALSELPL